jgi:plasmid maintenance system antidote protein VapI
MNANELADAMEIRASIRRKATSRKSVTEGANDRLADQLDQAATMLRNQQAEIAALKERLRPCQPLCKPSVCICLERNKP